MHRTEAIRYYLTNFLLNFAEISEGKFSKISVEFIKSIDVSESSVNVFSRHWVLERVLITSNKRKITDIDERGSGKIFIGNNKGFVILKNFYLLIVCFETILM